MPFHGRNHKMRMAEQKTDVPYIFSTERGVGRIWPFPVLKAVTIIVVMRNVTKIAEAQAQGTT